MRRKMMIAAAVVIVVFSTGVRIVPAISGQETRAEGHAAARQSIPLHVFQGTGAWQMVSAPFTFTESFSEAGIYAAVWQPAQNQYVVTPTPPANSFTPGLGYWVYLSQPVSLPASGAGVNSSQPFDIPLFAGWNQVGDPFPGAISLSNLAIVDGAGTSLPFTTALANAAVSPLYTYDITANQYNALTVGSQVLPPWQGAWIFTSKPVTLRAASPALSTAAGNLPAVQDLIRAAQVIRQMNSLVAGVRTAFSSITREASRQQSGSLPLDPSTGLYYQVAIVSFTKVQISYFTDSAGKNPAGMITINIQWKNGIPTRFPASLTAQIQGVRGVTGVVTLVLNDASAKSGTVQFSNLTDGNGDSAGANLVIANGAVSGGGITISSTDGSTITDSIAAASSGDILHSVTFTGNSALSGYTGLLLVHPDGSQDDVLQFNGTQNLFSLAVAADGTTVLTDLSNMHTENLGSLGAINAGTVALPV